MSDALRLVTAGTNSVMAYFGEGISEQAATSPLQNTGRNHIHHLAFTAEHARKIVFDNDAAIAARLQLGREEAHRLTASRGSGLRVSVAKQVIIVLLAASCQQQDSYR